MSDVPNRLLRETLRDRLEPSSDCLDADVLAAWADGTLSRGDRARLQSHAASCARCQAMLAAMARTAAPPAARKWWQATTVRWLVPLATVSTLAVVVWLNVPIERPAAPAARFDAAESRSTDVTLSSERPAPTPKPEQKRTEQRAAEPAAPGAPPARAIAAPAPPPPTEVAPPPTVSQEQAKTETFSARDAERNVAAIPPPAPAPPARLASVAAPNAAADMVRIQSAQQATDVLLRSALQIASPDRNIRWRIVDGNTVQRSIDGGAKWTTQSARSGARWTAGAAPAPTICWLVGERGAVLLSTDGQMWRSVLFPEAIDLVAILATDGLNATVTAADGRVFVTTDGGRTWRSP